MFTLCLHAFPRGALTSSNRSRHLPRRWLQRKKALEVHQSGMLLQTRRDRNICNYLRYTALPLKKSRKGWDRLPRSVSRLCQEFALNKSRIFLATLLSTLPTSPVAHYLLPETAPEEGCRVTVGYPACQSNVRAVRCVSLLPISSPTGGERLTSH